MKRLTYCACTEGNCRIKIQNGLLVKQVSHILEDGYFDKKIHSTMIIDKKIFLDKKGLLTELKKNNKKNITCLVECTLYDKEIGMLIQADNYTGSF